MYEIWTVRHKPRSLAEVVGNKEAIRELVEWARSWDKGVPERRAALLYGPPGVGKTVAVEALARDFDIELVETNASDYRTEEVVNRLIGLASRYKTLFGRKRLILIDELDGISGAEDRGGLEAIIRVIKEARCPIVLIVNDPYEPRFLTLRQRCLMIEFKRPSARDIVRHLKNICSREGVTADEMALNIIAKRSEGDVRSAVNDLQVLAQGKERLTHEEVAFLTHRDRKGEVFQVLRLIFYARTCEGSRQAVDMFDADLDMLFEWIYENVPYHLRDPYDLAEAMDRLAIADLYRTKARLTRNWKLASYAVDLMTAGVAMARRAKPMGWAPMYFPKRVKWLSMMKRERELQTAMAKEIGRKCHISTRRALKEFLPYLRIISQKDPKEADEIAKWLKIA